MSGAGPLLICFDGSDGARAAVEAASSLFAGHDALVACYWQPFGSTKRLGIDLLEFVQDPASINEREEQLAREVAEQGAALAGARGGLTARAEAVPTDSSVADAILAHAEAIDAAAIVLGSQGRSRLRSLILGSVANEIVQRAAPPVFVVPSAHLAEHRRANEAAVG
jgi:nucleotide-binding universal stress UspA family protein